MKTLIVADAFATVAAAPAFAQSTNFWSWKGASAAPASATSAYAYAGPLNGSGPVVRAVLPAAREPRKIRCPFQLPVRMGSRA